MEMDDSKNDNEDRKHRLLQRTNAALMQESEGAGQSAATAAIELD